MRGVGDEEIRRFDLDTGAERAFQQLSLVLARHEAASAALLPCVGPAQDRGPVEPKPFGYDGNAATPGYDRGRWLHPRNMRLSHTEVNAIYASDLRSSQWIDRPSPSDVRRMEMDDLRRELKRLGKTQADLAQIIGLPDASYANKVLAGTRLLKADEADRLRAGLAQWQLELDGTPDVISAELAERYTQVEVLPTFAGMGGGGTGEGPREITMLPRTLVEDELGAKPSDLLVINVRGNSMEPVFHHGDQLIIDRRDRNPTQPGPFALWDGDGYVVKNIEKLGNKLRIFSSNQIYSDRTASIGEVTIMGRPVWFGRRT